jgi:hypothetical protein
MIIELYEAIKLAERSLRALYDQPNFSEAAESVLLNILAYCDAKEREYLDQMDATVTGTERLLNDIMGANA